MKPEKKLTVEEFVLLAIDQLASVNDETGERRKTIHVVYSNFNSAFREYFKDEGLDPVTEVKKLAAEKKIQHRIVRGGAIIGRPGSMKDSHDPDKVGAETLEKMGLGEKKK